MRPRSIRSGNPIVGENPERIENWVARHLNTNMEVLATENQIEGGKINYGIIVLKADKAQLQEYYDDVLSDIEEQLGLFREAEELIKNIKNDTVRSEIEDILEDIQNQVSGHI